MLKAQSSHFGLNKPFLYEQKSAVYYNFPPRIKSQAKSQEILNLWCSVLFYTNFVCEHPLFRFLMDSWVPGRKTIKYKRKAMCVWKTASTFFPINFSHTRTHVHTYVRTYVRTHARMHARTHAHKIHVNDAWLQGVLSCSDESYEMFKMETVSQPYCVGIIYLGLVKQMTVA